MSEITPCPHCGALQNPGQVGLCWLCLLPLDAPPSVPPPPMRPLPGEGLEANSTAAALASGLVAIGIGALLISSGFGLLMTLIVVLPAAWVLGEMALASKAGPPRSYAPTEGPLRPLKRVDPGPESALEKALRVIGTFIFICIVGGAAVSVAAFAVCIYALGHAH